MCSSECPFNRELNPNRIHSQLSAWPGNFDHGAYKSGDKLEAKRDAFSVFLSDCAKRDPSYFSTISELIARDREEPVEQYAEMDLASLMSDWLSSKALRCRGLYALCRN